MKFVSGVCLNNDFGLLNCTEAKFFIQAVTAKNLMQNLQNVWKSQRCLELLNHNHKNYEISIFHEKSIFQKYMIGSSKGK